MNLVSVLLSLLPVGVIFLLLTLRKTPADIAGVIGWILTVFLAATWFGTAPTVIARSSLAGIVASFPISLVVAASIFQMTLMWETGSMARIMTLIKSLSPRDQVVQIMLINVGFATLLTSLGAVPVSTLPPIMLALGYSSFAAIALPAIGYDALCTYAMLGVPAVVFADVVSKVTHANPPLDVNDVGIYFARYMPIISTCIGLGMLWIIGRWKMIIKGFIPTAIAGLTAGFVAIGMAHVKMVTLTGIAAGIGVIIVMFIYLAIARKPLRDRSVLNAADLEAEKRMGLLAAMSPWLILIVFSVLVNINFKGLPLKDITFKNWAMPIEIVPKSPERLRLIWQAYTWVLVSSLLAIPFLSPSKAQLQSTLTKTWKRAPRPVSGGGNLLCYRLCQQSLRQDYCKCRMGA